MGRPSLPATQMAAVLILQVLHDYSDRETAGAVKFDVRWKVVIGHQAVIKPGPLLPAVEGGFTVDDFTVDRAAGTVTCPAGVTWRLAAKNAVIFGVACRDCPLRQQCTTAKAGRILHLHEHDSLLRAARADWVADPRPREDYSTHRPHVERAIAVLRLVRLHCLESPGRRPG